VRDIINHNLPHDTNPFFGRTVELTQLRNLLQPHSPNRLVTVSGGDGVGKSRLAVEVGRSLLAEFPQGVYFVPVSNARFSAPMYSNIAAQLGLTDSGGQIGNIIKEYLKHRQILLILDDVQNVVVTAPIIEGLLNATAKLKILLTGQKRLRLPGEHELVLHAFNLTSADPNLSPEQLRENEAVNFFVNWAKNSEPSFNPTNSNLFEIAKLVNQLEGVPLAIELTASRISMNTAHLKLSELNNQLSELLEKVSHDAPISSVQSSIQLNYNSLEADEKRLFRRLGVFQGSFDFEAAERVCNIGGDLRLGVQNRFVTLEKLKLVKSVEGKEGRFVMPDTLRSFAIKQMQEQNELETVQNEYAYYFLSETESLENQMLGVHQKTALDRVVDEFDNLRAVLEWAIEENQPEVVLRLAGALHQFWRIRGYLSEGRYYLEKALELDTRREEPYHAKALLVLGLIATIQGDYAEAKEAEQESLRIFRDLGNKKGESDALNFRGNACYRLGEFEESLACYEASLALRRELGDKHSIAGSLSNLGNIMHALGKYPQALAYHQESLAIRQELGDKWGISVSLNNLGNVAEGMQDFAQAHIYHQQSLMIRRELDDKFGIAMSLVNLGSVALRIKDYTFADQIFEEGLALGREIGDLFVKCLALAGLGHIRYMKKNTAEAINLLREAITLNSENFSKSIGVEIACVLFLIFADQPSRKPQACRLAGTLDKILEETPNIINPITVRRHKQALTELRQSLEPALFNHEWLNGRNLLLEITLDEFLKM
jgi:predicted ATPase